MSVEIVRRYVSAIGTKDIKSLSFLIDDRIKLILPTGKLISGKNEFLEFHEEWFAETAWTMENHIVEEYHSGDVALYILDITYTDTEEPGDPVKIRYYLTLVFERKLGEWKLVLDQNTIRRGL